MPTFTIDILAHSARTHKPQQKRAYSSQAPKILDKARRYRIASVTTALEMLCIQGSCQRPNTVVAMTGQPGFGASTAPATSRVSFHGFLCETLRVSQTRRVLGA